MMDLPVCPECRAELEWITIKDLQRVKLEPGDVLVVRAPGHLPPEAQGRIFQQLKNLFPDNQVLVLEAGLELCVVAL